MRQSKRALIIITPDRGCLNAGRNNRYAVNSLVSLRWMTQREHRLAGQVVTWAAAMGCCTDTLSRRGRASLALSLNPQNPLSARIK